MKNENELADIKTALSEKHKTLYTLVVPIDEDETVFATIYLKKMDRLILSAIQKILSTNDVLKAIEVYLKSTYVGGDEIELVTGNFESIRACTDSVFEMMTAKKSSLKKN